MLPSSVLGFIVGDRKLLFAFQSTIMAPLENLWVQILKFPFNYVISHNKISKYCTASNNGCVVVTC